MADALSVIPTAVLRNLSTSCTKRKNARAQKNRLLARHGGDHDKITAMMNLLTNEFTSLPQGESSKGGLIGLAAAPLKLFPSPSDIRTLCDALESRLEKNPRFAINSTFGFSLKVQILSLHVPLASKSSFLVDLPEYSSKFRCRFVFRSGF
ncbi:hypothetical protein Scep_020385 [Stephania cephalantha]|uniref:Uncharacterized protein n=1 Tax=Stephania cephalantha TaxID=152367 RepID=A0AAP0ICI5_9MAGN